MDHVEERLRRLERTRGIRMAWMPILCSLPFILLLAGASLDRASIVRDGGNQITERLVARSLVLVDERNRPRINLGIDPSVGAHMFLRDEEGVPMVTLRAGNESGSLAILDADGDAIAFMTVSSEGHGLLKLADSSGRTIARIGHWAGRQHPGAEFTVQPDLDPSTERSSE